MEVIGKLSQKLPMESGVSKAGKQWSKMGFIIQLESKFPKSLKIDVFNNQEMMQFINDTSIDSVLKCDINLDSKEYNGKWYHNITLWKAEVMREDSPVYTPPSPTYNPPNPVEGNDDLPF